MRAKDRGISLAYFEATAPTYDEAKEKALKGIRLTEREVRFKEEGANSSGVKVRAISMRTRVEEAIKDLRMFLDGMEVEGEVTGREEAGLIVLAVEGPGMGILIGKNGMTLEAVEYLLNIIHNRRFTIQRYVVIDAGGYRQKDLSHIESLLTRAVQHISNRGGTYRLPPMDPKMRKLTHLVLKKYQGFGSRSVGEPPRRCVEVVKASEHDQRRESGDEPVLEDLARDLDIEDLKNELNVNPAEAGVVNTDKWDEDEDGSLL